MKFRLLCFGSHLLISVLIAVLLLLLVYVYWYPSPLHVALGVTNIFLLLLGIDLVVGPLLTLVVAKQGKKTLKMDLLIIGILQMSALAYGLYTVAQGRPIWIVYDSGRFELVQAYEAIAAGKNLPMINNFHIGRSNVRWAAVNDVIPMTVDRRDLYYREEYLQPYVKGIAKDVEGKTMPIDLLRKSNDSEKVDEILRIYPDMAGYIPLAAKEKSLVVLIQKDSGMPLAIANLSPW